MQVRRVTVRKVAQVVSGVVVAAACLAACTNEVAGTPRAAPGQPSTTSSTPSTSSPSTTRGTGVPSAPTSPSVPTRTSAPPPNGSPAGADTTCDEYVDLDEAAQREVISAIAEENDLVALNPDLWITITSALCTFADPTTPVREVLAGQGIR